jgi:hypothetical protein
MKYESDYYKIITTLFTVRIIRLFFCILKREVGFSNPISKLWILRIMSRNRSVFFIAAAMTIFLLTNSMTLTTTAMASSKGGGSVAQEQVSTGNSNIDKEINKFYSCISKTHQDPPSIEKVDNCYSQTLGGSDNGGATSGGITTSDTTPTSTSGSSSHHHKHGDSTSNGDVAGTGTGTPILPASAPISQPHKK